MSISRRGWIALVVVLVLAGLWWMRPQRPGPALNTPPPTLTVKVIEPQQERWPERIEANGILAPWQEAIIGAETGSLRITELLADVGSVVHRGQRLAQLADASVVAVVRRQEAAVALARANLEQAQVNLQRSQTVLGSGALSKQQADAYANAEATARAALAGAEAELEGSRITLQQTRILAVDDGVISSRSAKLGDVVAPGTELFRMVRQGRIEWQAELDSRQLARVRVGQSARVQLPGNQWVEGKVRLIAPTLSTSTGRALVYVSLPRASGVQAGVFASGSIGVAETTALTLPESALVLRDGRSDVYLFDAAGGKVSRRTVSTGRRQQDRVEILSGLAPDARVVASGGAFLTDGASVQVVDAAP